MQQDQQAPHCTSSACRLPQTGNRALRLHVHVACSSNLPCLPCLIVETHASQSEAVASSLTFLKADQTASTESTCSCCAVFAHMTMKCLLFAGCVEAAVPDRSPEQPASRPNSAHRVAASFPWPHPITREVQSTDSLVKYYLITSPS